MHFIKFPNLKIFRVLIHGVRKISCFNLTEFWFPYHSVIWNSMITKPRKIYEKFRVSVFRNFVSVRSLFRGLAKVEVASGIFSFESEYVCLFMGKRDLFSDKAKNFWPFFQKVEYGYRNCTTVSFYQ